MFRKLRQMARRHAEKKAEAERQEAFKRLFVEPFQPAIASARERHVKGAGKGLAAQRDHLHAALRPAGWRGR
jgi:hypothetical protein